VEGAVGAHELLAAGRIAQSAHLDCFEIKTKEVQKCIRVSHWMKSLVVTPQNQIISGHRRWQAAKLPALATVPIPLTVPRRGIPQDKRARSRPPARKR